MSPIRPFGLWREVISPEQQKLQRRSEVRKRWLSYLILALGQTVILFGLFVAFMGWLL